jgi:dTDP-4-amino-4,6-dideoxygalactose transaminase
MDAILEIAKRHSLHVIEDSAQAFGATYKDRDAGMMSDCGCFSFYKTKNISTFEGGMICVPKGSRMDSKKIRSICDQGQVGKYNHEYLGFNFRLAEPLCLMAYEQIKLHMTGIRSELGGHPEARPYPKVVYEQPVYKKLGISGNCPVAEKTVDSIQGG